jgi:acetylornithine deacetylase/succinyl-diaminopimelate desuccinylase-like protein
MMRRIAAVLAVAWCATAIGADAPANPVRAWRQASEAALLDDFTALLRLPNVADDRAAIGRNADAIVALMKRHGLAPRLLDDASAATPPTVYGEWPVAGATRTIVFYAHYDGQPVDAADWASDPWTPTWFDGPRDRGGKAIERAPGASVAPDARLYARSSSDDKAGVFAILSAIAALKATGREPSVSIKLFFDGEEEQGSPHMAGILARHADLLHADAWIICDGPVHPSGRKQVVYGVRGDSNVDVTVYGPRRPLHSGHYGNWAPNPALRLARLLASMKDESGRVTIAGWYDDVEPLGDAEKRALAAAPAADADLRRELGLAQTEGTTVLESITQPSLNINGMRSADVGAMARNVIPTTATATLDLRMVKGNTPQRQFDRLVAHIRAQGYRVLDREPTDEERRTHPLIATVTGGSGYPASRTPMDLPIARAIAAAVQSATDQPIVELPTLGGSLPLSVIEGALHSPTITVPIANHDNNQHAENENLRIGNLWDGIEIMAALMTM